MTRAAGAWRPVRGAALALASGLLALPVALTGTSAVAATCSQNVCITGPDSGTQVSGKAVHITGSIGFSGDRLASWKVEVARDPQNGTALIWATVPDSTNSTCSNANANGSTAQIDCIWDTTKSLPNGAPALNGVYQLRITAHDSGPFNAGDYQSQANYSVIVVNPAATPTGLTLTFNDGTQRLTVAWNANSEPDLLSYTLNETINGKTTPWSLKPADAHCTSTSCNFVRQITTYGSYSYNVVAVRSAPGTATGKTASSPSAAQTRTFSDPNPTTTTSTTRAGTGGSTGGTGGGTGGGTSTGGNTGGSTRNGDSASVSGFRIVQIADGGPSTVRSSGSAVGRVVTGGSTGLVGEGEEPDTGYKETLPYKQKSNDQPQNIAQAIANIPSRVITDETARKTAMTITAVGLLLFVFAMQVRFITRRAAQEA